MPIFQTNKLPKSIGAHKMDLLSFFKLTKDNNLFRSTYLKCKLFREWHVLLSNKLSIFVS
jgi:hypothetical protein